MNFGQSSYCLQKQNEDICTVDIHYMYCVGSGGCCYMIVESTGALHMLDDGATQSSRP